MPIAADATSRMLILLAKTYGRERFEAACSRALDIGARSYSSVNSIPKAEHRGLLVTGPCGIGKSWLSCALAQKACRDGYTVHYARVPRLFADLDLAHGDGRFARLSRMLVRVDLLVLDDWGPDRLSAS
jgi:DNA replication protein DnaC